jgi:hypothetical protein
MRPSILALALAALLAAGARASADCAIPDRFAEHERAARVVVVEARASARPMLARLLVREVLKGAKQPRQLEVVFNPLAGESFAPRRRYVVFLKSDGTPAGGCTALEQNGQSASLVQALAGWGHAGPARGKAAYLVHFGKGKDLLASSAALTHLAARPDLLREIPNEDREAIMRTLIAADDERAYPAAWILGRLHALDAVPVFIDWLSRAHAGANARPVQDALELLTNHHEPGYTPGRDFDLATQQQLRDAWQRWHLAHRREMHDDVMARGFAERGQAPVKLTDAAGLAAILREGKDALSCAVALAACEQQAGTPETRLPNYFGGVVDWPSLAVGCRAR